VTLGIEAFLTGNRSRDIITVQGRSLAELLDRKAAQQSPQVGPAETVPGNSAAQRSNCSHDPRYFSLYRPDRWTASRSSSLLAVAA